MNRPAKLMLHNSLSRRVEEFVPTDAARITLYLCGPTVYNYIHIGNARGPVVFGVLVRLLRLIYGSAHVIYARNITDVDDKINAAAAAIEVDINEITTRYAQAYAADMIKLGAEVPNLTPYATAHIGQIIKMCETLIETGHAYAAEGHVLFDVASFAAYGQLSGRSTDEMIAGARVEVAPYKKNPADFVLWKPSTEKLPGWDSPWSRGRPGWHIECSAMSAAHLGETIDIHAGGNDLMFPHHENEIAQSTCAHGGKVFARYWLHNGMLSVEGRKMSKSLGNTLVLHELLQRYPAELLRFMLLKAHYRQPLDWSAAALEQAQRTLDGFYTTLLDLAAVPADSVGADIPDDFLQALLDDMNTPEALAVLSRLGEKARKATNPQVQKSAKAAFLAAAGFLGLLTVDPQQWFHGSHDTNALDETEVQRRVDARQAAKATRNFAEADRLRSELVQLGVEIEDTAQGPRWKRANATTSAR